MAGNNSGESLLDLFLFETTQNIEQLEKIVLSSEGKKGFDDEDVNEIFRIMHTIKGSSAMMSYSHISVLSHKCEDLFSLIREDKNIFYDIAEISDIILAFNDCLRNALDDISDNNEPDNSKSELITDEISRIINKIKTRDTDDIEVTDNITSSKQLFHAVVFFDEGCGMENLRAFSLIHDMESYASEIKTQPENIDDDSSTDEIIKNGLTLIFKSELKYDNLRNAINQTPFVANVLLETEVKEKSKIEINLDSEKETPVLNKSDERVARNSSENKNHKISQSLISVNVAKLDMLINNIGEAVIAESLVFENKDLEGLELPSFRKEAAGLHKIIREMQDIIMSLRMVSLSTLFQRIQRIVREMSKKLEKDIKIEFIGEETEVDKNVIEHISDPMLHLVRNAIDHGIESAEERIKKGKPSSGKITLEAYNDGNFVFIIVKDDGKGLDKNKILKKAQQKNLLTRKIDQMTDKDIFNLIFLPGFSTNDNISEYSGRGVGMDVVIQGVSAIGGNVTVESSPDVGTALIMQIPLTLSIIDGMNFMVGNNVYTIPLFAISEFFKTDNKNILKDTVGNEMIMVRGNCYGIMRLSHQLKISDAIDDLTEGIMILLSNGDTQRCLFVDKLIGQQQVVVKKLPEYIRRTNKLESVMGCTLLGDGSISLILDSNWLLHSEIET